MPHHVLSDSYGVEVTAVMHEEGDAAGVVNAVGTVSAWRAAHPTKVGRMVHARACVLIGMWLSRASRRLGNATKYGPGDTQQMPAEVSRIARTLPCRTPRFQEELRRSHAGH
jgi:hypothetical protein